MSATRWDSYFDSTFAWTEPGFSLCYPGFLLCHVGSQGLIPQPWRLNPNRWLTAAYIYVVLQMWSPTSWDMCTATLCCELAAPALLAREGVACGLVWWGGSLREATRGCLQGSNSHTLRSLKHRVVTYLPLSFFLRISRSPFVAASSL